MCEGAVGAKAELDYWGGMGGEKPEPRCGDALHKRSFASAATHTCGRPPPGRRRRTSPGHTRRTQRLRGALRNIYATSATA